MRKCNLKPLDARVIVDVDPPKERKGRIIQLENDNKVREPRGKVVAVGPGRFDPVLGKRVPMQVKKGDVVVFPAMSGIIVKDGEKSYQCLQEFEILAVVG